jgi:hypothetical protein
MDIGDSPPSRAYPGYTSEMSRVREQPRLGSRVVTPFAVALVVLAALLAGCSGVTSATQSRGAESAATPTPSVPASLPPSSPGEPAYCAPMRQLEADVRALGSPSVVAGGLSAVQQGVDKILADLNAVQAAAQADFGPQATNLRTSLTSLKTALQNVQSDLSTDTVSAVVTAAASVVASYGALRDAVANRCG